jgi:hypothetical protein
MKRFTIFSLVTVVTIFISACGGGQPAEPTVSPEDIQSSAVAAAFTIVAETQAAIPTNTPIPPTETPTQTPLIPTDTSVPDITATSAATSTNTPNSDPCLSALNVGGAGPTHDTLIKNKTGGEVILSLTLYTPNAFGACGAISATASGMVGLPSGYWYAFAYITLKNGKQTSASTSFFVKPAQFDKIELCITADKITYSPSC